MRRVISLWLPYLATDRLKEDGLFATVAMVGNAQRLAGVTRQTERAGLGFGLGLADARAVVPALRTAPADPAADAACLHRLSDLCRRWTPWTAVDEVKDDGQASLWLDVTGCTHLFAPKSRPDNRHDAGEAGEAALVQDVLQRFTRLGFTARAGLADTKAAAWAAARFLDRERPFAIVPEGAGRQILPILPVAALRLPADILETLSRLGLRTIADLMALPRGPLSARLGRTVADSLDRLLGRRADPFVPRAPVEPFQRRLACPEPIGHIEAVTLGLERLLTDLCARLARENQGARQAVLEAIRVDGTVGRVQIGTARPVRDPAHLLRLFREPLQELEAGFGIEVLVLSLPVVERLAAEQTALSAAASGEADRALGLLVDRLRAKVGRDAVFRPAVRPRHLPERATAAFPPFAALPPESLRWPQAARPLALLPHPEAAVRVGETLYWRRHVIPLRRCSGPERLSPDWWGPGGDRADEDKDRTYWRIEDTEGQRLWLFERNGGWFVHGLMA